MKILAIAAVAALLIAALVALSVVVILLGWNLGVVAIVAACGGHVAKIGFWTAFFVGLAINVLRGIFNRTGAAA